MGTLIEPGFKFFSFAGRDDNETVSEWFAKRPGFQIVRVHCPRTEKALDSVWLLSYRGTDDTAFTIAISTAKRCNNRAEADKAMLGERGSNFAPGFG